MMFRVTSQGMIGASYDYTNHSDRHSATLATTATPQIGMICLFGVILAIQAILIMLKNHHFSKDILSMIQMAIQMVARSLRPRTAICILAILVDRFSHGGTMEPTHA